MFDKEWSSGLDPLGVYTLTKQQSSPFTLAKTPNFLSLGLAAPDLINLTLWLFLRRALIR